MSQRENFLKIEEKRLFIKYYELFNNSGYSGKELIELITSLGEKKTDNMHEMVGKIRSIMNDQKGVIELSHITYDIIMNEETRIRAQNLLFILEHPLIFL